MAYKINEDLYIGNTNKQLKDLPVPVHDAYSTSTTDTYSCNYLNDTIDNSKLKSAILVGLSDNANITISVSWGAARVPFNKVIRQIGNGLTLDTSTGIVTASEEVKAVRISYGIALQEAYTTNIYPRIMPPTGTSYFNGCGNPSNGIPLTGEIIGDCSTSKTMYTEVKSSQTGTIKIKGEELYSYMLVEEL